MFFMLVVIGQIFIFEMLAKADFVDNSVSGIAIRQEMSENKTRFFWRMNLFDHYDHYYDILQRMKYILLLFEPLPIDYGLFLQAYEDSAPFPSINPIDANELHFHQLYHDSSAVLQRTPKQIFVDFFVKYNAAFATLHFWVESFMSSQLTFAYVDKNEWAKNYSLGHEFDRLAYYTFWFLNLEIDRHFFDLKSTMQKYNLEDPYFRNVFEAFRDIHVGMNDLVSLKLFIDKTRKLLEYGYKKNPFDSIPEKDIFPINNGSSWLLIIQHLSQLRLKADMEINVQNLKYVILNEKVDTKIPLEYVQDPNKYAQYLYHNCWSAIDIFMGNQLYIMESFFYATFTGSKYPQKKFRKPTFQFSKKLKRNFEKYFSNIWHLDPKQPRQILGDHGDKIYRSSIIEVLRAVDYLRFGYVLPNDQNYQENFVLKSCHGKLFERPRKCAASFKLIKTKGNKIKNQEKNQARKKHQSSVNKNEEEKNREKGNERESQIADEVYEPKKNKKK